MRIGFLGPAPEHGAALREAAEFLLGEADVDRAIYLGNDNAPERMVTQWCREILGSSDPGAFLDQAAALAVSGSPDDIRRLLSADTELQRLASLRKLPAGCSRAVEMIEDRIVLAVHDKAILDEEDIANADVIVYGKSDDVLFKRFGPRCFFTPGPMAGGKLGIVDVEEDGRIGIALFETSGAPLWRELLQARTSRVSISG